MFNDQRNKSIGVILRWWKKETDDEQLKKPFEQVDPPEVDKTSKEGISMYDIELIPDTCDKSFLGQRNRSIILTLLDCGLRRSEFIALNIADVNMNNGSVFVRKRKGHKPRQHSSATSACARSHATCVLGKARKKKTHYGSGNAVNGCPDHHIKLAQFMWGLVRYGSRSRSTASRCTRTSCRSAREIFDNKDGWWLTQGQTGDFIRRLEQLADEISAAYNK